MFGAIGATILSISLRSCFDSARSILARDSIETVDHEHLNQFPGSVQAEPERILNCGQDTRRAVAGGCIRRQSRLLCPESHRLQTAVQNQIVR